MTAHPTRPTRHTRAQTHARPEDEPSTPSTPSTAPAQVPSTTSALVPSRTPLTSPWSLPASAALRAALYHPAPPVTKLYATLSATATGASDQATPTPINVQPLVQRLYAPQTKAPVPQGAAHPNPPRRAPGPSPQPQAARAVPVPVPAAAPAAAPVPEPRAPRTRGAAHGAPRTVAPKTQQVARLQQRLQQRARSLLHSAELSALNPAQPRPRLARNALLSVCAPVTLASAVAQSPARPPRLRLHLGAQLTPMSQLPALRPEPTPQRARPAGTVACTDASSGGAL